MKTDRLSLNQHNLSDIIAAEYIVEHNLHFSVTERIEYHEAIDKFPFPTDSEAIFLRTTKPYGGNAVLKVPTGLVELSKTGQLLYVDASATNYADALELLQQYKDLAPPPKALPKDQVRVSFWHWAGTTALSTSRTIVVPEWKEIETNYTVNTRDAIKQLMERVMDSQLGGRLILWHGDPGAGKTYALRALAREWQHRAEFHYIMDPEQFFGAAMYLDRVVLDSKIADYPGEDDDEDEPAPKKWRVLVLEDTGEMLTSDAKQRIGQGLQRLLNLCDGLIGQGLRVMVLITTNEDLGTFHPAVMRSGRCAANIEFGSLTLEETTDWADRNELAPVPKKSMLLADLYAELNKTAPAIAKSTGKAVGFRK